MNPTTGKLRVLFTLFGVVCESRYLKEPKIFPFRHVLVVSLVKHFRTGLVALLFISVLFGPMLTFTHTIAKDLISQTSTKKGIAVIARDISWLWRMAYNSAVKGCSTWECPDDLVSDLFDISREVRVDVFSSIECDH